MLPLVLAGVSGMGTFLGGLVFLLLFTAPHSRNRNPSNKDADSFLSSSRYSLLQSASAGCMLTLSLDLYLIESTPKLGFPTATLYAAFGFLLFAAIHKLLPDGDPSLWFTPKRAESPVEMRSLDDPSSSSSSPSLHSASPSRATQLRSAVITFSAMAVHNIPEGVSVAYTTEYSLHLGISLCIAILLHNIL
ncbi:MAG: hypothetical protein SGCHY_002618, partial [Lobulomycetales sp.]